MQEKDALSPQTEESVKPESEVEKNSEDLSQKQPSAQEHDQKTSPIPKPKLHKAVSKKTSTPSLTDLSSFEKEIHSHQQQAEAKKQELNLENLQNFFKKLAKTANPPSTRAVIRNTEVHLKNGQLELQVGSDLEKSTLLKEAWIIEDVRAQFGKSLKVLIEVDPERRKEPEEQKPISNKEIFDEMVQANPMVKELRDTFSLRFDRQ